MASRKQRRRRQKERRHEYEYVYVDDSGHEVEPPPEENPERDRPRAKNDANGGKQTKGKATKGQAAGRPVRQARPPSWNRSIKRAALFLPLFFIVFSIVNKHSSIEVRFLSSLAYSALFVPLTYVMDRTAYRTYLRRSGQQPAAKR